MSNSPLIRRVVLRNYKSIGACDVSLGKLNYLVGRNGAGKSNFLDALHFVADALNGSLDSALKSRGGLSEVRRRSSGHPNHFAIRLEWTLPDGRSGHYAFNLGAIRDRGYEVQTEECCIGRRGLGPYYRIKRGQVVEASETTFPNLTSDRLALVAASGMTTFRPVFDSLSAMSFYNLNPSLMRELQKPQDGRLLKSAGENIASVLGYLERVAPDQLSTINDYLRVVVPEIHGVERKTIGPMETLEFRQNMAGEKYPWRFRAQNMSDGTLRALGVLLALFQNHGDSCPGLVGIEEPETALHPAAGAALRDAIQQASSTTQIVLTSHSPDLLDAPDLPAEAILAVVSEEGVTRMAPIDEASRKQIQQHLFTAGELLRLEQLVPDRKFLESQKQQTLNLFGDHIA